MGPPLVEASAAQTGRSRPLQLPAAPIFVSTPTNDVPDLVPTYATAALAKSVAIHWSVNARLVASYAALCVHIRVYGTLSRISQPQRGTLQARGRAPPGGPVCAPRWVGLAGGAPVGSGKAAR